MTYPHSYPYTALSANGLLANNKESKMNINAENMEQLINKLVKINMEDPDFPVDFFKIFDVHITYDDMSDEYKIDKDDFDGLFPKKK